MNNHADIHLQVLQTETKYKGGAFVCMYSRALVFASPLISNRDIMDFRRSIINDLHFQSLSPVSPKGVQVGLYYSVD